MPVQYETRGHVGIVTLSRSPARNAWGEDFTEGIKRYFDMMEDDDDIRCAVLTGDEDGRAFSAGANLKDPNTHSLSSMGRFYQGPAQAQRPAIRGAVELSQAPGWRDQWLRHRYWLHRHVLLRSHRRLGAGGMALAAGGPGAFCPLTAARRGWRAGSARASPCAWPWAFRSAAKRRIASV